MKTFEAIRTESEYDAALARAEKLFGSPAGSPESEELDTLLDVIQAYERMRYPFIPLDPIEAIRERMASLGLRQKDLVPAIGNEGNVSLILKGKRSLTVEMIRNLSDLLGLSVKTLVGPTRGEADKLLTLELDNHAVEPFDAKRNLVKFANSGQMVTHSFLNPNIVIIDGNGKGSDLYINCNSKEGAQLILDAFDVYIKSHGFECLTTRLSYELPKEDSGEGAAFLV
jgi:HTH-type transcriptional regulator/antitoxin HigA